MSTSILSMARDYITRYPRYYKIPKSLNDVLYDVQFGDNVGLITFASETYVAFDDKNLYYDVSSDEQMAKHGIQIVTLITA